MVEKEERILVARSTDYTLTDTDKGELFEGKIAPHCANVMTRQETIEKIAKALWETGYNEVLNISFEELRSKSHKSKSTNFSNFYKLTMEKAEAVLNALLETYKFHKGPKED